MKNSLRNLKTGPPLFALLVGACLGADMQSKAALEIMLKDPFYPGNPQSDKPALNGGGSILATFEQDGVNKVILTIQANLSGGNFVKGGSGQEGLFFNFAGSDPLLAALTIAFDSSASSAGVAGSYQPPSKNAYKADGDGYYDLAFMFSDSAMVLDGNEKAVFNLTGAGLTENDFLGYSVKKADGEPYSAAESYKSLLAAAHVQGLTTDPKYTSTFIYGTVVPEPSTYIAGCLLGIPALVGCGRRVFRRRHRQA